MKAVVASALLAGLSAITSTLAYSATSSWYWPETGNQGACGGYIKNGDWVVALDARHYDRGGVCGKMIRITANGRTQVARIGDRCEMCRQTDGIDMTPDLFSAFADRGVGIINVNWEFVDGSGTNGGGNGNSNNNGGGNNEWKPEPPKQEPPKQEPPKNDWTPPKEEWKPPQEEWKPPKQEPEPAKQEWTPPKEEWKPPAQTPQRSQPAWTPPASSAPSPSSSPIQNQSQNDNGDQEQSRSSSQVSSTGSFASNATASQSASIGYNATSSASSATSGVPSMTVSLTPQQDASMPVTRNTLAHLHQAVLQVASLVVGAADAI